MSAVQGRAAIAEALSALIGAPRSPYQVDRLAVRPVNPLPVHGSGKQQFSTVDELSEWWQREQRRAQAVRGVVTRTQAVDPCR